MDEYIIIKTEIQEILRNLDALMRLIWNNSMGVGNTESQGVSLYEIKKNLQKVSSRLD